MFTKYKINEVNIKGFMTAIVLLLGVMPVSATDILDNTCTFRTDGRLFVLTFLNRKDHNQSYYIANN